MALETNNNKEQILMIVPAKGEKLSKSQVQFNTLVKKIETLSILLMEDKEKLQKLLSIYLRKVSPQNKKAAELQFELAKEFANAVHTLGLGSRQTEEVGSVIIWLMNQSFSVMEPNKEKKEFFNLWSKQGYDEKEKSKTQVWVKKRRRNKLKRN